MNLAIWLGPKEVHVHYPPALTPEIVYNPLDMGPPDALDPCVPMRPQPDVVSREKLAEMNQSW